MSQLIMPVVSLSLCLALMGVMMFISKKRHKRVDENERKIASEKAAQDFVNVKEIKDIFLYTQDGYIFTYVRVHPISYDLLTVTEQQELAEDLTDEFSQIGYPFKFLAVSRPIDIAPIINKYYELINDSNDQVQKELLRQSIRKVSEYSLSGDVVQREFYYMLWIKNDDESETDLRKLTGDLVEHIENAGLKGEILKRREIIMLCNLVNNPAFAALEDTSAVEASIPFLNLGRNVD